MKSLELKKVTVTNMLGKKENTSYEEWIRFVVNYPGETGYKLQEMENRLRIIRAVNSAKKGIVTFEDADAELLKILVANFPWTLCDEAILTFSQEINAMK